MGRESSYWTSRVGSRLTRRRVMMGGLSLTGAAMLAACSTKKSGGGAGTSSGAGNAPAATGTPIAGGTFSVAQVSNPPTLDYQRTTSFYTLIPSSAVYSRLLRFKTGADPNVAENHDVEPDLALSAESPDAITYTVKLRPNAKFQTAAPINGHAVQSEDVKQSFVRALGQDNPARSALSMIDGAGITTPDANTVVFKLNFAYAPFPATLASPNYSWIYPREVAGGGFDPATQMTGSGPFLLDNYTPDVAFTFKKNPDWFDAPMPHVNSVRFPIIPDKNAQRAQFVGGNLDYFAVDGTDVEPLKRDKPNGILTKGDPGAGQLLFVQLGDPTSPFQDIRLRQAVSLGIDRDNLAKAIYNNDAVAQWFVTLNMGKWALHQEQLPADAQQYYKYDPANAKKLLQASGVADQQFKLIYATNFLGPAYEQAAQTVANMLSSSGFKITPVAVDYVKDYIAGGKGIRYGNYDKNSLVYTGISSYTDIDEFIANYYHSKGTAGLSRLNDPAVDDMIAKARTIVNVDNRVNAYLDIQRYLAQKLYTIAGIHLPYTYTMRAPRVQNYQPGSGYGVFTETYAKLWLTG
jgi:peptide/nickel transport system substrate-binding protein